MIKPNGLNPFKRFCITIGELPSSYMESMTYYEMLEWFCKYLEKTVIPAVNNNAKAITELQNLYIELKNYVDNYFANLDVQEEINNKLDDMAESGELADIISIYLELSPLVAFDTVADMKAGDNLSNTSKVRTLGLLTYNDGKGELYRIRDLEESDVIDEVNLISLTNYPTLVAELLPNQLKSDITTLDSKINILEGQVHSQEFGMCKEVAHRGCPEDTIENTITSFQYAYNKGFKYFECDVQLTSDGNMVLFHNVTVDSTTNGSGTVNELSYSYLRSLVYTAGGNITAYPNTHINDINELVAFLKQTDIKCFLEIKQTWSDEALEILYATIKINGLLDKVIFISFNPNYILKIRSLDSKVLIAYLFEDLTNELIDYCKIHNFIASPILTNLTKSLVDRAHYYNVSVYVWTITSKDQYQALLATGVDYMCTNSRLYCYPSTSVVLGRFKYVYPYYSNFDKISLEHGNSLLPYGTGDGYPTGIYYAVARATDTNKINVNAGDVLTYSIDTTKYSIAFPTYDANGSMIQDSGWLSSTSYTIPEGNAKWTYCYFKKNDETALKDYELDYLGSVANNISITRS